MGELLNLVGLGAGVVLYAMLLAMVVRSGRAAGGHAQFDPLLLATALLGLIWNLLALPAYELPKAGFGGPFLLFTALGFGALGFLPAVVVHSVLRGERDGVHGRLKRAVAATAYAVSLSAAGLQLYSVAAGGSVPSPLAMQLLTYTFVALMVPLAAATRGQHGSRRALWAAALAIFAVSALHLSQFHQGDTSWPVELVGHHASLPLAFAILYQDYPFALADLFLKRALALLALVTVAFIAVLALGSGSTSFARYVHLAPRQVGIVVTVWVATALLYPILQHVTAWFVDTVLLRRPDYRSLRRAIARRLQLCSDIVAVLDGTCELLAPALSANSLRWQEWPWAGDEETAVVVSGAEATTLLRSVDTSVDGVLTSGMREAVASMVVIPTAEPPRYAIVISELTGGRRFLSDDLATLEAIGVLAARRIDVIRVTHERFERELRVQEIAKLATEAELRALRAQINPHFLFNALTTIGYLIQAAPARALQTLLRLTSLLRAVLRSEGEFTTLGRELEVVESYLDIERARFEQRLRVTLDVPADLRNIRVPPLILQPIVENAVKHGISPLRLGGEVTVTASVGATNTPGIAELLLVVRDTGMGATPAALERGRAAGVGLSNVERRLIGQYGTAASLSIRTILESGTTVEIRLPVQTTWPADASTTQVIM